MYVAVAIGVLAIIAMFMIRTRRSVRPTRLSKLAMFAFLLILFGVVLADAGPSVSYSLMGGGVFLAVIDIIKRSSRQHS